MTAHADKTLLEATYTSKHSGINISLTRSLKALENNIFIYTLKGTGKLLKIEENSTFLRENDSLKPLDYSYKRRVFGVGRKEYVHFDWDKNEATYKKGKSKPIVHPLKHGVLDSSLYQLQMQMDLYSGKKDSLIFHYIQKDKLRTREFTVSEHSDFTLDGNTHKTLLVTRLGESNGKKTEITVLPNMFYQIAEIRQTQKNGEVYETRLTKLTYHTDLMTKFYSDSKI